jgi:hypothetical protein
MNMLGWLVGVLAATGALWGLEAASMGFYASQGGLMVAGMLAFIAGTVAAALVDLRRIAHSAVIVAVYIAVLFAAYQLALPPLLGSRRPGATPARATAGVLPPP